MHTIINIPDEPVFMISEFLKTDDNIEDLKKKLFKKGILTKDYPDDGLMLLYHKYETPIANDMERECRSLIIDTNTKNIISYSCETPRLNKEGLEFLEKSTEKRIINTCYEGTYISLTCHNTKWYVSTRRCLNSSDSVFDPQQSHYDMFVEVLLESKYNSIGEFTDKLDQSCSYYFVLIHHNNKHTIDYTPLFGEKYKKLCLATVRNSNMVELDIYENRVDFASYEETSNIFIAEKLENLETYNNNITCDTITSEGLIVRLWNPLHNKYNLIKLQNMNYQFNQVIGGKQNMLKGMLYLYQNDKLKEYFHENGNKHNMMKLNNPYDINISYDMIGVIDSVFKVCSSELFTLFTLLWSLKTGKQQNLTLYNMMPKEYKNMLYGVRGIYYKKKATIYNVENITSEQIKSAHLKITDIYNYLKNINIDTLLSFLRMRRLMLNLAKKESNNLQEFNTISHKCEKINLKLCAIFTSKLFPEILPSDVPSIV